MDPHPQRRLNLKRLPDGYAVARLEATAAIPPWALEGGATFVSISRTASELSIVCRACDVPAGVRVQQPFRCFQVRGPLPFTEVGVLASLAAPLAEAGISLFVVSTFDTDYLLVPGEAEGAAKEALRVAGHEFDTDQSLH